MNLKKALVELNKFSPNKAIPITENVMLRNGRLIATNLETFVSYKVGWEGDGLIPLAELKKIADKNDITDVSFEGNTCSIRTNGSVFKFETDNVEDFPDVPERGEKLFTLEYNKEIQGFKHFVGNDDLRPALSGVFCSDGRLVATNAHYLRWVEIEGVKGDIIIPPSLFKIPLGMYQVYKSGKWVSFISDSIEYTMRLIDEKFPDYKVVIPETNPVQFRVGRQELIKQVNNALICANSTSNLIVLNIKEGSIKAKDLDLSKEYKGAFSKHETNGDFEIGFNGKFLLTVLNNEDGNDVRFAMSEPNRAAIIDDRNLLMPAMLYK